MHAQIGDHIVVESHHLDSGRRRGTVVAVLGDGDEAEHYQMRWEDGHESVFFPGPDARIETAP